MILNMICCVIIPTAFEINNQTGEKYCYVTNSGFNVAKYFAEDYIYQRELPYEEATEEYLWMTVRKGVYVCTLRIRNMLLK